MALTSTTSVLVRDPDTPPQGESRVRLRQWRAGPAVSPGMQGWLPGTGTWLEAWTPSPALRRSQTCRDLELGLLASRTVREHFSVVSAAESAGLAEGSPGKPGQTHSPCLQPLTSLLAS